MKTFRSAVFLSAVTALCACGSEEAPPPMPVEETFIGEQVKVLREAENYEEQYLDAVEQRQQRMEEQIEKDGG